MTSKTQILLSFQTTLLIDTGASQTCVSSKIIKQFNLLPISKEEVFVPSGKVDMNLYLAKISIPFGRLNYEIVGIPVFEYKGDVSHYHGLLGRDILRQGIFINAGWDKKYYFSI